MAEWAGLIQTTARRYLQGAQDLTLRQRFLLMHLNQKGRIEYGNTGEKMYWDVKFDEPPMEQRGDSGALNFTRYNLWKQLNTDWRGYAATDMMTEKEKLMNDSPVAIVKRYDKIIPNLEQTARNILSEDLYVDGYAAGNENRLCGLNSFTGTGTVAAGDVLAQPSDTYGDLSTAVGNYGGTWSDTLTVQPNATISKDWPNGRGSAAYDFMSPKLINLSSNAWGTGSTTVKDNIIDALMQTTSWMSITAGEEGQLSFYLMARDLWYSYKQKLEARFRIVQPHKASEDLGFPDTIVQDGILVRTEFDVPAGEIYGINANQMKVMVLGEDLFKADGPTWSPKDLAWLFSLRFYGNVQYSPKFFAKLKAYA